MRPASQALQTALMLRPLIQGALARRALPGLLMLIVLVGMCSILGASLLLGSLYALYLVLLQSGLSPLHAMLVTLGAATALLGLCLMALVWRMRRLHRSGFPPAEKVAGIIDAFIDGYQSPGTK